MCNIGSAPTVGADTVRHVFVSLDKCVGYEDVEVGCLTPPA